MARNATTRRVAISTIGAWFFGFLIFFPILWMVLASFKTESRGLCHSAVLLVLPLDHGKLCDRAGAQRLPAPRAELDPDRRRLDAGRAVDRDPRSMVNGVLADQAHQGHPALDALDQDDAAGRRAGADLPDLQDLRPARFPCRTDLHPLPRQFADRDLDAVHLFQGDPARHPRGRAHGRRHHRPRDSSMC